MAPSCRVYDLVARYDGLLVDAYGVLNDADGALPGARALVDHLHAAAVPFLVVTNDASRSPAAVSARLAAFGIAVPAAQVLTSGQLIAPWAREHGVRGRCLVLGTDDSRAYVAAAGLDAVSASDGAVDVDAIAICDDGGYDFLAGLDAALSAAVRRLDRGAPVALVLPNPDLVYPKRPGELGFTAGAAAMLVEEALRRRYPGRAPRFAALGKPHAALFVEARRRLAGRLVMIGDQLETDVAGALAAGIDAALVEGVSRWDPAAAIQPTWRMADLR